MSDDETSVSDATAACGVSTSLQQVLISSNLTPETRARLYARATHLAVFTIGYNLIEGLVSVFFGIEDGTSALRLRAGLIRRGHLRRRYLAHDAPVARQCGRRRRR